MAPLKGWKSLGAAEHATDQIKIWQYTWNRGYVYAITMKSESIAIYLRFGKNTTCSATLFPKNYRNGGWGRRNINIGASSTIPTQHSVTKLDQYLNFT